MDNIKIHVWELPEKITDIDPSSEYTIVHDGIVLKKVTIEKLFKYFSQDFKIENLINTIQNRLNVENTRYILVYDTLTNKIDDFEKEIKDLEDKFVINKDKIRNIITLSGELDNDTETLSWELITENNKLSELSYDFNDYSANLEDYETRLDKVRYSIIKMNDTIYNLMNTKSDIEENNEYISKGISSIKSSTLIKIEDYSSKISTKVNEKYDRILAIIDHYHHIFNEDTHQ